MVVGGECFGEPDPFHDDDGQAISGQAISEAPILVAAAPVQLDSGSAEFRIERNNLDELVGVSPAIAFRGGGARRRRGERVEPLPKHGLGCHNPEVRPDHDLVPGYGLGAVLISFAGEGNPKGCVREVARHYRCSSPEERP